MMRSRNKCLKGGMKDYSFQMMMVRQKYLSTALVIEITSLGAAVDVVKAHTRTADFNLFIYFETRWGPRAR